MSSTAYSFLLFTYNVRNVFICNPGLELIGATIEATS